MSFCPKSGNHIRDKANIVLDLSNYATKKEIKDDTTGANTSNLVTKSNFIALKAEVDKLDTYILVNVPTCISN